VAAAVGDRIVLCADLDVQRAEGLAADVGARATDKWDFVTRSDDVDAVVVATFNDTLSAIAQDALRHRKDVLCEKPFARTAAEALPLVEAASRFGRILKVGFNHRHHPAIAKAHDIVSAGGIGDVKLVRVAYGHGGRPGYEQEWRTKVSISGGGELLDQGIHAIDLSRWFLGDFTEVTGLVSTEVWPIAPVEDNAVALMRTSAGGVAVIHCSWTQWKNLFRFEVFGSAGYVVAEGLGGSYGPETLAHGLRSLVGGPPTEERWEFPGPDRSWELEWGEFRKAVETRIEPPANGRDGYAALRLVDGVYLSAKSGCSVAIAQ
jgi:predicted dehydrogenase